MERRRPVGIATQVHKANSESFGVATRSFLNHAPTAHVAGGPPALHAYAYFLVRPVESEKRQTAKVFILYAVNVASISRIKP